nr:hypothetical protein [Tanacetum cinerariifolium]
MRGFEYGEQDRKAAILYEYDTFKATEGKQLLLGIKCSKTFPLLVMVFLLGGGGAIFWTSKKKTCIIGSIMESEFVALAATALELLEELAEGYHQGVIYYRIYPQRVNSSVGCFSIEPSADEEEKQRISRDTKIASRLQEEIKAASRQRMAQVHQAAQTFIEDEWENIRARVKADKELTQKLQAEEREKYSKDDRTKMLVDLINQRKKFFAQRRAKAKRNNPMTQSQQRTYMIQDFVPMEKKGDKEVFKLARAGGSKRDAEEELDQGSSKKQKNDEASGLVQEQPVKEEKELS